MFQFQLKNGRVNFNFILGKGDNETREKLYAIYERNNDVFTKVKKASGLSPIWHQAFQKQILSEKEMQDYDSNVNDEQITLQLIEERFRDLIDNDLPKMMNCIDKEIISY